MTFAEELSEALRTASEEHYGPNNRALLALLAKRGKGPMPHYRHCTNLAAFAAEQIEADGGKTDGLVPCELLPGFYFDTVDSRFLTTLADYRIGDPIPGKPDPEGKIRVKNLDELKASHIVGCYTTLEAIMTPAARKLLGWGPEELGADYVAPDQA